MVSRDRDPGFRPARAVAVQPSIPKNRYGVYEPGGPNVPRQQLYDRLEKRVRVLPAVDAVAFTGKVPMRQIWNPWAVAIDGRPPLPRADGRGASRTQQWGFPFHGDISVQTVSSGYFSALGVLLLRWRAFDDLDRPPAPMAAVINAAAARVFFPNEDPIGKRLNLDMTTHRG